MAIVLTESTVLTVYGAVLPSSLVAFFYEKAAYNVRNFNSHHIQEKSSSSFILLSKYQIKGKISIVITRKVVIIIPSLTVPLAALPRAVSSCRVLRRRISIQNQERLYNDHAHDDDGAGDDGTKKGCIMIMAMMMIIRKALMMNMMLLLILY